MPRVIRTLALTGAAAVALLSTATTATADTPEQATAIVDQAVARATGAPVSLPDGRTMTVTGLDSVSYRADAAHKATVADLSAAGPAQGAAPQLQPGATPQLQPQAAAGTGAITVGIVLMLVLGIVLFFGIKNGKVSKGWAGLCGAFGITLGSTFVGPMVLTIGGSALAAVGQVLGGL
ncbi:hypothetical protein [Streptomyces tanashiensis]|uniref:hypothetical protein n=1 Tax=Streptomyces tanashiensis TaxID=67367 RepID=UPI0033EAD12A